MMTLRIGIGQDSHRLDETTMGLVIGGVTVADQPKLKASSDGDVVLHAIFNAISSARGGRSLGMTADKMCLDEGITDSREYLKVEVERMKADGYRVGNVSVSIECKKPKIEPLVDDMKAVIAELLDIEVGQVGITATSGDGLTDFGRGLGVQCLVMVGLVKA